MPADPRVAARWVALVGHGALDAEAYPEMAAPLLDLLWGAAKHPEPEVRVLVLVLGQRWHGASAQ